VFVHVCMFCVHKYVSSLYICVYVNVSYEYIFQDETESIRQVLRCCVCAWVHVMCMHVCIMCIHMCMCECVYIYVHCVYTYMHI